MIVMGSTGSGKTRSIKNLDPKETYIINILSKDLPFKDSAKLYSNDNMICTDSFTLVKTIVDQISEKKPNVKNLIIDDAGFLMSTELFDRASEKTYEKFTEIGKHMQSIIKAAKDIKKNIKVVFMFHDENVESDRVIIAKKLKLIGA